MLDREILGLIGRIGRAMLRNADVMVLCGELERRVVTRLKCRITSRVTRAVELAGGGAALAPGRFLDHDRLPEPLGEPWRAAMSVVPPAANPTSTGRLG